MTATTWEAVSPEGGPDTVPPETFREVMTRFARSVTVVTAHDGTHPIGCTATAVLSLTDRPPTLLASLASDGGTLRCIRAAGRFGVSVLPYRHRSLAARFAELPAARRFDGVDHASRHGVPLLGGAVAGAVCRVTRFVPVDDHTLVIGHVVHAETGQDAEPLIHFARRQTRPEG
ncbi:flavin reductase (DIM6/NTAB) family NADH-FMN oxidoreductase RutF [Streptomyces sp. 3330]|uniref:flavin reductase family protein n=1 Tax=Streptomyces sp. 3330 TaxID=2817755 RepID=UPI002858F9A5|nr:flavin reductase family protein [Streptomyces sp. 3330]MDR6979077.1 flavin reductase (DIM6/NTAB) family NADH-FMN oxidoreductase RutF [Streptomyces sp. 3330]